MKRSDTSRESSFEVAGHDTSHEALERVGFVVLTGVFAPDDVDRLRAYAAARLADARKEPTFRAGGTLHVDLDAREAAEVFSQPRVSAAVAYLLSDYEPLGAHYRAPTPGNGAQALHADYPIGVFAPPYKVATVIVPLVDFRADNGATRVIPGSHRKPFAVPKQSGVPHPDEVVIAAPAGSAIVMNGHVLHSGTRNSSRETRDALQVTYRRRGEQRIYPL